MTSSEVLRSRSAFDGQPLVEEVLAGVAGARVLLADYDVIRRHTGIADADAEAIDEWLLRETAFISRPQAAQEIANTPIRTTARERSAIRPPRYCRAAVLESEPAPGRPLLLDVKGCGIEPGDVPTLPNSNGLLTISEAIHELAFERFTRAALAHGGSRVTTLPIYALIDLGFEARFHGERPDERAVLLVRAAQTRPEWQWGRSAPGPDVARELLDVELTLRRYGITASSCGAIRFVLRRNGGAPAVERDGRLIPLDAERLALLCERVSLGREAIVIDGVNVQVTSARTEVLDFGRYRLRRAFEHVVYAAWERDFEALCGDFVTPGDGRYVQPDPRLSLAGALEDPSWGALCTAIGGPAAADRTVLHERFEEFTARALARLC